MPTKSNVSELPPHGPLSTRLLPQQGLVSTRLPSQFIVEEEWHILEVEQRRVEAEWAEVDAEWCTRVQAERHTAVNAERSSADPTQTGTGSEQRQSHHATILRVWKFHLALFMGLASKLQCFCIDFLIKSAFGVSRSNLRRQITTCWDDFLMQVEKRSRMCLRTSIIAFSTSILFIIATVTTTSHALGSESASLKAFVVTAFALFGSISYTHTIVF